MNHSESIHKDDGEPIICNKEDTTLELEASPADDNMLDYLLPKEQPGFTTGTDNTLSSSMLPMRLEQPESSVIMSRTSQHQQHTRPDDPRGPVKEVIRHIWLLAVMTGFLVIICLARQRTAVPPHGSGWYSIGPDNPLIMQLVGDVTYLEVDLLLPAWQGQMTTGGGSKTAGGASPGITPGVLEAGPYQGFHKRRNKLLGLRMDEDSVDPVFPHLPTLSGLTTRRHHLLIPQTLDDTSSKWEKVLVKGGRKQFLQLALASRSTGSSSSSSSSSALLPEVSSSRHLLSEPPTLSVFVAQCVISATSALPVGGSSLTSSSPGSSITRNATTSYFQSTTIGCSSSSSSNTDEGTSSTQQQQQLLQVLTWTAISPILNCSFMQAQSTNCVVEWSQIRRINSSLPAAIIISTSLYSTSSSMSSPSATSATSATATSSGGVDIASANSSSLTSAGNTTTSVAAGLTSSSSAAAVYLEVHQMGGLGLCKEWLALVILVLVLLGLSLEVAHRTWVAFTGAFLTLGLLLLANRVPTLETVMSWVDYGTMGLLVGMMLIVGQLQKTGMFQVICAYCLRLSKGNLLVITVSLCCITAVVSAWLDNVTTMLLMALMTMTVFEAVKLDPVPLLMIQAMLSNIGGTATLIGDPPNILIGLKLQQYIGFIDFMSNLAPGVLLAVPVSLTIMIFLYPRHLKGQIPDFHEIMKAVDAYRITDWSLFVKCVYVTGGVIIGFLLQPVTGLNPAWVALVGATILILLTSRLEASDIMTMVEWDMLLFFCAMFILVQGAVELGLINRIAQLLQLIINTSPPDKQEVAAIQVIIWFSALFSAVLDNIPYTITLLPVIEQLALDNPHLRIPVLAWALAFGACFGGNGTLIGASANIVTATLAEKRGHAMGFMTWLKAGVPVSLGSLVIVNIYMLLRYCT